MIVGEAHVVVRAITSSVGPEIRRAFSGNDVDRIGQTTGRRISDGISRGLSGGGGGGGGGLFAGLAAQSDAARAQFDNLIRTAYTLGPAMAGILGAVSSLIGAFAGLAATVAGAIPSLSVLPGLLANVAIAGGTLKLAFAGVGEAISAGMKQATSGVGGAAKAARDLTAELRRLDDAKKNYRQAVEDGEEGLLRASERRDRALTRLAESQQASYDRLKRAQEEVTQAIADGERQISDARGQLAEAERSAGEDISDAKRKVAEAQLELNDAYAKAREEIEQLNFAAEDAAINEKKAALELEKARETLLRVQDLPPNSRARREAELAFAQADLNYRKAMDTNKDLAKEQERLAKEGVDGTKTVQDAKKKLNDATENQARVEAESARRIAQAQQALADAVVEAARRKQKAEEDFANAQEQYDRDRRDAAWELQDIERQFADEQERINQRIADAKRELKRAEEDLAKARKKADESGAGGANAYQKALAELAPAQRAFVEYMVKTFMPSFKDFKAAAGEKFFPALIPALENLRTNLFPALLPLFRETGGALGGVVTAISGALTNPQVVKNIEGVWNSVNTKILPSVQSIAANAIIGITGFLAAAQPLVERFVGWIEKLSGTFAGMFDTEQEQSEFTTFLTKSGNIAAALGRTFGSVFGGLGAIIKSQMEPGSGGWMMLNWLENAAKGFEDFTKSDSGMKRIEDFFKNTAENAQPILGFIGDLVKEFLKLGENPNIGAFFEKLREADIAKTLGDIGNALIDAGPAISDFVIAFANFAKETLESEAIKKFFETLTVILDKLTEVISKPEVKSALGILAQIAAVGVALRLAWGLAKVVILGVINPLINLGKGISGLFGTKVLADGTTKVGLLSRAIGLLGGTGPVGIAIAAITGLVLAFIAMWNESEKFRDSIKKYVSEVIAKITEVFNMLKDKVNAALEPIGGMEGAIQMLKDAFKFLGDIIGTYVMPVITWLVTTFWNNLGNVLGFIIDTLGFLLRVGMAVFGGIKTAVGALVDFFMTYVWPGIKMYIDFIVAIFNVLWTAVKFVWDGIYGAIEKVINWFKENVWPIISVVVENIKNGLQILWDAVKAAWDGIYGAIETVVNWLRDNVWPIISVLWEVFMAGVDLVWGKVSEVFGWIKDKINTVFTWVRDTALPIITGAFDTIKRDVIAPVWDFIRDKFNLIKDKITEVFNNVRDVLAPIFTGAINTMKSTLQPLLDKVREIFDGIRTRVSSVTSGIRGMLTNLWGNLTSGLASAVERVKGMLRPLVNGINALINGANAIAAARGSSDRIPTITGFAEGGIVFPQPGGVIGRIAEAGRPERIEPLDPDGLSKRDKAMIDYLSGGAGIGSGVEINIYSQPGMDEVQLANIVSREISFMMRKGSI